MKIIRNGLEFELTTEEIAKAHDEFVMNFMKKQFIENYGIRDKSLAEDLAQSAYDRYCEGYGETEGECIEWSYNQKINKVSSNNMSGGCYVVLQK